MKSGERVVSLLEFEVESNQNIREAAANLVNDVIFRAKEMAQRPITQQKEFSVVQEETEEALLGEELSSQYPTGNQLQPFSGLTPEIQIDLVGDRTPSPNEPISEVAPVLRRQVKIKHSSTNSSEECDNNVTPEAHKDVEIAANGGIDNHNNSAASEVSGQKNSGSEPNDAQGTFAKDYMSSKPANLAFVDDSPTGLECLESPSEAIVLERVAGTKSSQENDMRKDPSLRRFVEQYIQGIAKQAQLLADERVRELIPNAKDHSLIHEIRPAAITMKSNDGSWYDRARNALNSCLESTCFCTKSGRRRRPRQPEPV